MKLSTGEKITVILKRKRMTVGDLAQGLGWSREWTSRKINEGADWKLGELRKVAEVLGIRFDELIGEDK